MNDHCSIDEAESASNCSPRVGAIHHGEHGGHGEFRFFFLPVLRGLSDLSRGRVVTIAKKQRRGQLGFTAIEVLCSLTIGSFVLSTLMYQMTTDLRRARDHQIRLETFVQAQAVVQTMVSELRMAGNGVPFDQANFMIGDIRLSDPTVTEPIVAAASNGETITFRLNETGNVFLLTSDFDPASSLTINLTDVSTLTAGAPIYLSNSTVSGTEGLFATVNAVNTFGKSVTINPGYITTLGSVFPTGSILEEVRNVVYEQASDGLGITRDSGAGAVLLAANSTMSIEYLDFNGNSVGTSFVAGDLVSKIRSLRVTVNLNSERNLSDGNPHTVSVVQTVGIRNLIYFY